MKMLEIFGWLVALTIAAVVGLSSYSIVNEVKAPIKSLMLGFPPTANASGNAAALSLANRSGQRGQARVSEIEERLALHSYRGEPLSVPAIAILALQMTDPVESERRQALLEDAGRLSRRNGLIGQELIKSAALRGDTASFFQWLSRSVLVNERLRQAYLAAMADATAREGAVKALTPVLGRSPQWAPTYWRMVSQRRGSLVNATELRIALAGKPWNQTDIMPTDSALSLGLVNLGEFATAQKLSLHLAPSIAPSTRTANILINADFTRDPLLPPFDWELASSGNLGASIDTKDRSLIVSAIGGARGIAARQIVHLPAGNYQFGWQLTSQVPLAPQTMKMEIRCAERNVSGAPIPPIALNSGKRRVSLAIRDSGCQWYWASIMVALADDSPGMDVYLRELSLVREAT